MIKKTYYWVVTLVTLFLGASAVQAQNQARVIDPAQRQQMMEKQAEQLADEFKLKDEARVHFMSLYQNYQADMAKHAEDAFRQMRPNQDIDNLSEEDAAARLKTLFDDKAQQIVTLYNRLEVEKKYYEEFAKTLSSKQLLKIFSPRMPGFPGNRMGQRSGNTRRSRQSMDMNSFGGNNGGGFGMDDDF